MTRLKFSACKELVHRHSAGGYWQNTDVPRATRNPNDHFLTVNKFLVSTSSHFSNPALRAQFKNHHFHGAPGGLSC